MKEKNMQMFVACFGLLFVASTCFGQMYTVTPLGMLDERTCPICAAWAAPRAINISGMVTGTTLAGHYPTRAFRTAPNTPINPATDDLGTLGGYYSDAYGINALGQVVGTAETAETWHAFRTSPNSPINPATDDLGTLGGDQSGATGINDSGQVVGWSFIPRDSGQPYRSHAFRTAPNSPINSVMDDLGTLGETNSKATAINAFGQVVGTSYNDSSSNIRSFRTAPNSPINAATDDLASLGGNYTYASGINDLGQVVGWSMAAGDTLYHGFRTAPNRPINPATDDLGSISAALAINAFGEVVGSNASGAFLYSNGLVHDLNALISASGCILYQAVSINDSGQIVADGFCSTGLPEDGILLTPIFHAFVKSPIDEHGSSVFNRHRGVLPVKFTLTQYGAPTCTLLPAKFALTRIGDEPFGTVDESTYLTSANDGLNFRIDPTACEYIYNLPASSLEVGKYQADININGIAVGHAVFVLK